MKSSIGLKILYWEGWKYFSRFTKIFVIAVLSPILIWIVLGAWCENDKTLKQTIIDGYVRF